MKKILNRISVLIAVVTISVVTLVGCGSAQVNGSASESVEQASDLSSNEERVIRLGNFPFSIWNAQIILAYRNGYFDEVFEGKIVKIEITDFANGPAANEAFIAGDLDIINGIGDQPVVIGIGNDVKTKILSGAAKQGENIGIIATKESNIKTTEDLKGKRIGVFIGTYVHKSVIGILNDAGIAEDEVELVNISSTSDATAAFDSGDIDAYLSMSGDYIQEKLAEGFVKVVDCSAHPAFSYIVASTEFVDNNQDILTLFFEALVKAQEYYENNTAEAYQDIADFADLDVETVKNTIEGAQIQLSWDDEYQQNLINTYDFLYSHDMITTELSDDEILGKVDTSIIDSLSK